MLQNSISENKSLKILAVRTDRIGDVILTTPALQAIKESHSKVHLTFLAQKMVAPLFYKSPIVDRFFEFGISRTFKSWIELVTILKDERFDGAIIFQTGFFVASAIWWARIPIRVGPLSKWYSFFFYNRSKRQSRSKVEKHEADYNLDLVSSWLGRTVKKSYSTSVSLNPIVYHSIADEFKKAKEFYSEGVPLVVVHPGMGGSALNLSFLEYANLIELILNSQLGVLLTGGEADSSILNDINAELKVRGVSVPCFKSGSRGIDSLGAIFNASDWVVAPSTGPLHLAVALGKQVSTFYPPILVQSAKRWGPYCVSAQAHVNSPQVQCPASFQCQGNSCEFFRCMSKIDLHHIAVEIKRGITCQSRS